MPPRGESPLTAVPGSRWGCGQETVPLSDDYLPRRVPFDIPYPVETFASAGAVEGGMDCEQTIEQRLHQNMYYVTASERRRHEIRASVLGLSEVLPFVLSYLDSRYPRYHVHNVSLFGSYAYCGPDAKPGDIDLLITVRGNCYLLDEVPVCPTELGFGPSVPSSVKQLGLSIKGTDNFQLGIPDPDSKIQGSSQQIVINRTVAALGCRHIVLTGSEFRSNPGLLAGNLLAEASDLLVNGHQRFYRPSSGHGMSKSYRFNKLLSRLYEAAIYMMMFCPKAAAVDLERLYDLKVQLASGRPCYPEVEHQWRHTCAAFDQLCASELTQGDWPLDAGGGRWERADGAAGNRGTPAPGQDGKHQQQTVHKAVTAT